MTNFNFKNHFDINHNLLFFNQNSYSDFYNDICLIYHNVSHVLYYDFIALKISDPYWAFVYTLALFLRKKITFISHKENDSTIEIINKNIPFKTLITDKDIITHNLKVASHFDFDLILNENGLIDKPNFIFLTSGSSGHPKGISHSFKNIYNSTFSFNHFFNFKKNETYLLNLPHHHVAGMMVLFRTFFASGKITTNEREHFDFASLVPMQLNNLLKKQKDFQNYKNARALIVGGQKISNELLKQSIDEGFKVYESYGLTEMLSTVTINGTPLLNRKIKIDNNNCLNIKSDSSFIGHYIDGQFIKNSNEWFKTSDIVEINDHKLIIKERNDLTFISGGENINPLSIEDILLEHPEIINARLIPIKDQKWGEIGILLYESNDEKDLDINLYLKNKLHPYFIPKKSFIFQFNQNNIKISRFSLKEIAKELYLKNIFSYNFENSTNESLNVKTLVMLHGFMGDKSSFNHFKNDLIKKYNLLTIDLPGHGETLAENFYDLNDIVVKLSEFIKIFDQSPYLYGYSMGGRIALQLLNSELKIENIFLESSSFGLSNEEEKRNRFEQDSKLFTNIYKNNFIDFLDKWYGMEIFYKFKETRIYKNEILKKENINIDQLKLTMPMLSQGIFPIEEKTIKQIKNYHKKIIYIYGEKDFKYKALAQKYKSMLNDQLELIEIKNSGHNPYLVNHEAVLNLLKS